jgi:hypothetical protein
MLKWVGHVDCRDMRKSCIHLEINRKEYDLEEASVNMEQ